MYRKIGTWDSKGSEQDIEDVKTVSSREKVCFIVLYNDAMYLCTFYLYRLKTIKYLI